MPWYISAAVVHIEGISVTGWMRRTLTRWHAPFAMAQLHMISDVWMSCRFGNATDFEVWAAGSLQYIWYTKGMCTCQ